ncbi:MAG: tetratricopeptide repeat protein [bacterium]|nr:tetratricopeptide repeat protein [bacterium]
MRQCARIRKHIRYVLSGGKLPEKELRQLQTHLASCSRCREIYDQEQELNTLFQLGFAPYHAQKEVILARLRASLQVVTRDTIVPSVSWWVAYRRVWVTALLIVGVLLSVLLSVLFKQLPQPVLVKAVRGTGVFYLAPGSSQWIPAQEKTRLPSGSQLATNRWSQVELRVGKHTQLWLNQSTQLQLSQNIPIILFLQNGELFITQPQIKTLQQVRTPAGVITPVGTSYDIRVLENGITQVAVVVGQVQFSTATGSVVIPAGYQSQARVGQQTSPSSPARIDTSAVTEWVDKLKKVTRYSLKRREQLTKEAITLGNKYYREKQYYAALTTYHRATELMPDWASGYVGIGNAHYHLKQYDETVIAYMQALALNQQLNEARYYLVLSLMKLGQYAEARPQAEWLVKQVPNDHAFSIVLAEISRELGYLNEAEQWYRHGLTQSPCEICMRTAQKGLEDIAQKRAR